MDNFDGKTIMGTAFDGKTDTCHFFLDHFGSPSFFFFLDHFGQLSIFLDLDHFLSMGHHFFRWCEKPFSGGAAD